MTRASGTKKGRPRKPISQKEREWVELIVESGLGSIEAARKIFGWKCEPNSSEARRAVELTRATRIKEYMSKLQTKIVQEVEASKAIEEVNLLELEDLRAFFYKRLCAIRDNEEAPSQTRYNAIQALKKLADPSSDHALIMRYLDIIWRGMNVHCPRCHSTYPMWQIRNNKLEEWRQDTGADNVNQIYEPFDRRMEILSRADRRKTPHPDQKIVIAAPERHVAGLGAARGGKSFLLAMMALLAYLTPGVEIWVLARVYDDAKTEVEDLKKFLNTLFFPHLDQMVDIRYDSKSGELTMDSKWGSLLRVRSAKSKGSITGRELEMALVAEPGWVPAELYEELRARMSSRLGRIILLGTPKGYTGILARMVNQLGRDPETGKMRMVHPEERTIKAGMPWISSMLIIQMDPANNPAYVIAEKQAARAELTDAEYESEFEGKMVSDEGNKFHTLKMTHLHTVPTEKYENCVFAVGFDQGTKNKAAVLLGFDGSDIFVAREYFACDNKTIKYHMREVKKMVPYWLRELKVDPSQWKLTIFDSDPPVIAELTDFESDPKETEWPTDIVYRPKNMTSKGIMENWRDETYEYVNRMCASDKIHFDESGEDVFMLHDQLIRAQNRPLNREKDSGPGKNKGWIINDAFRGDHVCDAFILAMWVVYSGQLSYDEAPSKPPENPWEELRSAFQYRFQKQEQRELGGYLPKDERLNSNQIFEKTFGRPRPSNWLGGLAGYYPDES